MSGFIPPYISGPSVIAKKAYGTTITVDSVNGSDSEFNDGTVTPLKSLDALFQRMPTWATGLVATQSGNLCATLVILKAGTYTFST